ncbi:NADH-quinone oxidoreductase subunit NuoK [Telmatocola sphagniphila]|uniref:NADH-quinone oxidoreductase subunit K n=1 Tax=Telmatocola sphagniphila TaxID=1123043 RepID=A0A8E6EVZ2_9BACT|nr:NADH-quinone oxidoreductase subunit NuoK [Telmatocola sphagniphila]QVL33247.1 NADH-quinone oxidoreductase subunit NuoK [Telmatocola sphagniphila]
MNEVGLVHYQVLSAFVFACGLICILSKRNAIGILMGVELILNASNINFVASAKYDSKMAIEGPVFALIVIVLAAAEAAVALAIILNFYNNHQTIDVDRAEELKG